MEGKNLDILLKKWEQLFIQFNQNRRTKLDNFQLFVSNSCVPLNMDTHTHSIAMWNPKEVRAATDIRDGHIRIALQQQVNKILWNFPCVQA